MKINPINNNQNNFRGYKNLKIVGEKLVEVPNSKKAIKVFIAGGKEIDKKVAEANKKALEKCFTDRVSIAGGKEIDKKVAEANKKAMEKYFSDRVTIAGGKEIDRKVAEANKKIAEANI